MARRGSAGLSGEQLDRLAQLVAASPHNLVSARDRERVRDSHISESAAVAERMAVGDGQRWLDLGTGGGLPGLVLAARYPSSRWVLLDATAKKVDAVLAFARQLRLGNVDAVHARAERLAHDPGYRGGFDGVVSRAVAPLPVLSELARGFLRPGGALVAIKGPRWAEEVQAAQDALRLLRFGVVHTERVESVVRPTWMLTMRADGPVPAGYPRKNGLPRSRPLGTE